MCYSLSKQILLRFASLSLSSVFYHWHTESERTVCVYFFSSVAWGVKTKLTPHPHTHIFYSSAHETLAPPDNRGLPAAAKWTRHKTQLSSFSVSTLAKLTKKGPTNASSNPAQRNFPSWDKKQTRERERRIRDGIQFSLDSKWNSRQLIAARASANFGNETRKPITDDNNGIANLFAGPKMYIPRAICNRGPPPSLSKLCKYLVS